ncbi:MAG: biotin-dependent carboxyltransferase family protein [Marmoricola sp.]
MSRQHADRAEPAGAVTMRVLATGPLTTYQDAGRPGHAGTGVGRSGACDRTAYRLANRLVGNPEDAVSLEVTLGGLRLEARDDVVVATAGARCPGDIAHNAPRRLRAGEVLELGPPASGLRTYVALRGGLVAERALGSCATDVLSGLGPPPLAVGDVLVVGRPVLALPGVDLAAVPEPEPGDLAVAVTPGPRRDWFTDDAWGSLLRQRWTVTSDSNRVGVRLAGEPLARRDDAELPSEGMVRGALQVPPSGRPVLFLADHPVTGGYPVIACVREEDVDACGQLRPGQGLLLRS